VGERHSEVRHELVGWQAGAMAGASKEHNLITGNLFNALFTHLGGKRCRTFVNDMKVRVNWQVAPTFFYPDVLVVQDKTEVTLHRRANGWKPEVISSVGSVLELRSLEFSLPLAAIYEEVKV
jgi:Uma2 family endonuclease